MCPAFEATALRAALRADRPNAVCSLVITYLPTTFPGICPHLCLVVDVWSRKVVSWHLAEVESAENAVNLVQSACITERYRCPTCFRGS
jgi:transposase InsO family protein